jgi:hypothetical protein
MNHQVVENYLNNFSLINSGMEAFAREQSKLLSPAVVAISTDYRGTLTEHGIDGYFRALEAWLRHFRSNHQSPKEFLDDTRTHVLVRVLNRLGRVVPVNGLTVSEAHEHDWTEEFEVGPDGLISNIHVTVILKQPATGTAGSAATANQEH